MNYVNRWNNHIRFFFTDYTCNMWSSLWLDARGYDIIIALILFSLYMNRNKWLNCINGGEGRKKNDFIRYLHCPIFDISRTQLYIYIMYVLVTRPENFLQSIDVNKHLWRKNEFHTASMSVDGCLGVIRMDA